MTAILWVMLGGSIGSALRYGVGRLLPFSTQPFPWATFCVNLIGSLLIGMLAGYLDKRTAEADLIRWFWMSGFCGGFTTFSAFSLETLTLIQTNRWMAAAGYIAASSLLGILLAWTGWYLFRMN